MLSLAAAATAAPQSGLLASLSAGDADADGGSVVSGGVGGVAVAVQAHRAKVTSVQVARRPTPLQIPSLLWQASAKPLCA